MKLTPAEYKLLDALNRITGYVPISWLKQSARRTGRGMLASGLISKRAWTKGYVVATALGNCIPAVCSISASNFDRILYG